MLCNFLELEHLSQHSD